eukprot:7836290-Lingulodinium_polyedra.AAC.1
MNLERGLVSMVSGSEAEEGFAQELVSRLPSRHDRKDPEQVLQSLHALKGSERCRLAPRSSQSLLAHVIKMMGMLCEGQP